MLIWPLARLGCNLKLLLLLICPLTFIGYSFYSKKPSFTSLIYRKLKWLGPLNFGQSNIYDQARLPFFMLFWQAVKGMPSEILLLVQTVLF